jgi:hypothetical protein
VRNTNLYLATAFLLTALAGPAAAGAPAGHASGNVTFGKHSATIEYGWLVRGPDEFNRGKSLFRIYFSSIDVGAKIAACSSLSCADDSLVNGAFIDVNDSQIVNFWMTLDGGHVQYSGGVDTTALKLDTNRPDHLAGKFRFDESSAGGGKLVADFDLPLMKTFK